MPDNLPVVSIVIPCRNEERFIGRCLDSIIDQDYSKNKFEILVVDGMSEDRTRQIVENYSKKYSFIKLLGNPKKITPCALNIGIKNAKGEIIMRMDAHATYDSQYISKCVKYLEEYKTDNVGGTMVTLPRKNNLMGRTIVDVLSSPFGVGGSSFRTGSKESKWVDTVFGGCYRKEVFEKIGLFNENLPSSQDIEFNRRLKKTGGKILMVPDISSYYYARSDFKSFVRNNFRNGFWAIYPFKFSDVMPVSLRHLVPLIFVLSLVSTAILSSFFSFFWWFFFLIFGLYALTNLYFSCKIGINKRDFRLIFIIPFIFATLHIVYGIGSMWAGLKLLRR